MPEITITRTIIAGGEVMKGSATRTVEVTSVVDDITLAAGKAGTLTTRTDANTGVATLSGGHGIISTQHVDVYWATGMRFDMTCTVSGNAVTIDGGTGDDLPTGTTPAVVVSPRTEITLAVIAAPTVIAAWAERVDVNSTAKAHVEFQNSDEFVGRIGLDGNFPQVFDMINFGATNGFGEQTPNNNNAAVKAFASNGSSSETADLMLVVGQDATP